jgi:steroid delta-isomerase-like uncharacterized protein
MSIEQNKKIVHRYVEEVSNRRNVDAIGELISDNYIHHYDDGTTSKVRGPDYVKESVSSVGSAYPDAHFTIEDMIAEGDKVVYRWTATGTHQGEDMGIAATGKRVTLTGITILRIEDGKIAERWASEDTLGMMRQLGVIPAPGDQ